MEHKKILDRLACQNLIATLNEEITFLVIRARGLVKWNKEMTVSEYVVSKLLKRWNNVLQVNEAENRFYKEKVYFVIGVLLHKYGIAVEEVTTKAIEALKTLDDNIITSDKMSKELPKVIELLKQKPVELKKNPRRVTASNTHYRVNDVIAINISGIYHIAYVHKIFQETPIIEFYESTFDYSPKIDEMKNVKAKGIKYNDESVKTEKFMLSLAKRIPDFANQIHLIGNDQNLKLIPDNSHLTQSIGEFTGSNVFNIAEDAKLSE